MKRKLYTLAMLSGLFVMDLGLNCIPNIAVPDLLGGLGAN